jgi:hypothetical protein
VGTVLLGTDNFEVDEEEVPVRRDTIRKDAGARRNFKRRSFGWELAHRRRRRP